MRLLCRVLPIDSLDRVAPDWTELAAAYRDAPFLELDFVRPLIEAFATGRERLAKVSTPEGNVAAVGIFSRRQGMWETFQPSQLPTGCLVTRVGTNWSELLSALGHAMPGITVGVAASQQDPLFNPRPASEGQVTTLDYIETAAIEVVDTFKDYWNARGKNLRLNLRKQRRRLADQGIELSLDVLHTVEQVQQAIEDYAALESAGWKADGGTAISMNNPQGVFYRRMLENFCARDRGRVYRYRFADKVVAVDLCIESEDSLVILKTTYDESVGAFSPAALMREESFRQIWQAGRIRRIEFYGKKMEWHTRWTDQSRTLYHVNWHRWPALMRIGSMLRSPQTHNAPSATTLTEKHD